MKTPPPPYYAVIFSAQRTGVEDGYGDTAALMEAQAAASPGYLGHHSARGPDGFGITVSYWASEEDIFAWKRRTDHVVAQRRGRMEWYEDYEVRVAKVERVYDMARNAPEHDDKEDD